MSAISNILISFVQQLKKPPPSVAQAIFAVACLLLPAKFANDRDITYPDAAQQITTNIALGQRHYYDMIVVGSGSSGSVLAGKLAAKGVKVLLIEAGGNPLACCEVPKISFSCMMKSSNDWIYYSVDKTCRAQKADKKGRRCYQPRAKCMGGCSSMNLMYAIIYWYGLYDLWVKFFGCHGWGSKDVIPYFVELEGHVVDFGYPNLGYSGPLTTSAFYPDPFYEFLNNTYKQNNEYQSVDNINKGDVKGGFCIVRGSLRDCRRCSASKAFVIPVKDYPNLTIIQNAIVVKILIKDDCAYGIRFLYNCQFYEVYLNPNGRLILSAGVYGTPILLMLSGIGPRDYLEENGIACIKDLQVVRKYLWDHLGCWIWWSFDPTSSNILDLVIQMAEYMGAQTGPFCGTGTLPFVTFTIYNEYGIARIESYYYYFQCNSIDLPVICGIIGYEDPFLSYILEENQTRDVLLCVFSLLDPKSHGCVGFNCVDPKTVFNDLYIDFKYLSHPDDIVAFTEGMNFQLRLMQTKAFRDKNGKRIDLKICNDLVSGLDQPVDTKYMTCYMEYMGWSVYHPAGTCRMGSNSTTAAVNSTDLTVFGFKNIHVCDASIVPILPYSNLNYPCCMFAIKLYHYMVENYLSTIAQTVT